MSHTPIPWKVKVYDHTDETRVEIMCQPDETGFSRLLARLVYQGCETTRIDNAEFIVRACNCHDELLEACESFVALFDDSDMRPEDECHEVAGLMRKAIAKATAE